ncbi:MAG: hypothetical protein HY289_04545 [Planctomycetes bacterium]|nr:hypothetical protein [Planctomycetota bacterium]
MGRLSWMIVSSLILVGCASRNPAPRTGPEMPPSDAARAKKTEVRSAYDRQAVAQCAPGGAIALKMQITSPDSAPFLVEDRLIALKVSARADGALVDGNGKVLYQRVAEAKETDQFPWREFEKLVEAILTPEEKGRIQWGRVLDSKNFVGMASSGPVTASLQGGNVSFSMTLRIGEAEPAAQK